MIYTIIFYILLTSYMIYIIFETYDKLNCLKPIICDDVLYKYEKIKNLLHYYCGKLTAHIMPLSHFINIYNMIINVSAIGNKDILDML